MTAGSEYSRLIEHIFRADRNLTGFHLSEQDVSRLATILRIAAADMEAEQCDALDFTDPCQISHPRPNHS